MSWTTPRTYVTGEVITAAILNTHIRDNFNECVLRDGTVPLTASWDAGSYEIRAQTFFSDASAGVAPLTISSSTVVTNLNSDMIDGQHIPLTASATPDVVPKNVLTASGDLPYANGPSSWTRLPAGTALQMLRMNSSATAPEWVTGGIVFAELSGGEAAKATTTWADWDISAMVPSGAAVAHIVAINSNVSPRFAGVRQDGSTVSRKVALPATACVLFPVNCGVSRIIEIISEASADVNFNVTGYYA